MTLLRSRFYIPLIGLATITLSTFFAGNSSNINLAAKNINSINQTTKYNSESSSNSQTREEDNHFSNNRNFVADEIYPPHSRDQMFPLSRSSSLSSSSRALPIKEKLFPSTYDHTSIYSSVPGDTPNTKSPIWTPQVNPSPVMFLRQGQTLGELENRAMEIYK